MITCGCVMITLITSLLVSVSTDELNKILQSEEIKQMDYMKNSLEASQMSEYIVKKKEKVVDKKKK